MYGKQQGGLGLRDTRKWNDALLTRLYGTFTARRMYFGADGYIIIMSNEELFERFNLKKTSHH